MKKSGILRIIVVFLLLVVVGVGIFGVIKYSSSGGSLFNSQDISTFYLTIDDKKITDHADGYVLSNAESLSVQVSFPYAKIDNTSTGYSVKIVPSGKVNFEFAVGNEVHTVVSESDFTSLFVIEKHDKSFTVSYNKTFVEFFSDLYPNDNVYLDLSTLTAPNVDMFRIVVTPDDGSVITVDFSLGIPVESVSLNSEVIVF